MIALMLKPKTARALLDALPDDVRDEYGETAADLHITLVYLGEVDDYLAEFRDEIAAVVERVAGEFPPIKGEVSGYGVFNGTMPVVYASYDSPDLSAFRQALWDGLKDYPIKLPNDHGFDPHITLAYADTRGQDLFVPTMPASFEAVSLVWASERQDLPLTGSAADLAVQKGYNAYNDKLKPALKALAAAEKKFGRGSGEYNTARFDYLDALDSYMAHISDADLWGHVAEYSKRVEGTNNLSLPWDAIIEVGDPNNLSEDEKYDLRNAYSRIKGEETE